MVTRSLHYKLHLPFAINFFVRCCVGSVQMTVIFLSSIHLIVLIPVLIIAYFIRVAKWQMSNSVVPSAFIRFFYKVLSLFMYLGTLGYSFYRKGKIKRKSQALIKIFSD